MAGLLALAAVLALLPFLRGDAANAEIVLAESGEIRSVSLSRDASFEIESRGVHLVVRVQNGEISVAESDCRDGVCKNTPAISRPGQTIVCAPSGVVVRVVGEGADVDAVSG